MSASAVAYTSAFADNVRGELKARFRLDDKGKPRYETDDDDPERRHYYIDLLLESERASRIESVTYNLHESYWDPMRISDDQENNFAAKITAYGDYQLEARVLLRGRVYSQKAKLSQLLEAGHADNMTPAIQEALERISKN